jgi:hypothetical protein
MVVLVFVPCLASNKSYNLYYMVEAISPAVKKSSFRVALFILFIMYVWKTSQREYELKF